MMTKTMYKCINDEKFNVRKMFTKKINGQNIVLFQQQIARKKSCVPGMCSILSQR